MFNQVLEKIKAGFKLVKECIENLFNLVKENFAKIMEWIYLRIF